MYNTKDKTLRYLIVTYLRIKSGATLYGIELHVHLDFFPSTTSIGTCIYTSNFKNNLVAGTMDSV